ncbi:hypothetical protein ACN4EE_07100 [Geminocystis sp. CENA526]
MERSISEIPRQARNDSFSLKKGEIELKPNLSIYLNIVEYFDFIPHITERNQIKPFIEQDKGVIAKEQELNKAFKGWWELNAPNLAKLPENKAVMQLRTDFMASFVESLQPVGLLDRFKVAGVIASWWDEVRYELRTLSESGFNGLVDSWVDTIKDGLGDNDDSSNKAKFDPLNHKLVKVLLADYLAEIETVEGKIAELEQEKESFEQGEGGEDTEEGEEVVNVAKELDNRVKELKASIKDAEKRIKWLNRSANVKDKGSIAAKKKLGEDTRALEQELAELEAFVIPITGEITEIEEQLQPYNELKERLKEAKNELKELKNNLIERLDEARRALRDDECQKLVLAIFFEGLEQELERYVTAHRQQVIAVVENWWDKYRVTFRCLEEERSQVVNELNSFFEGLGYV